MKTKTNQTICVIKTTRTKHFNWDYEGWRILEISSTIHLTETSQNIWSTSSALSESKNILQIESKVYRPEIMWKTAQSTKPSQDFDINVARKALKKLQTRFITPRVYFQAGFCEVQEQLKAKTMFHSWNFWALIMSITHKFIYFLLQKPKENSFGTCAGKHKTLMFLVSV